MKSNCSKKTLDVQHTQRLQDIQEKIDKIDNLKRELTKIESKLSQLEDSKKHGQFSDSHFENYMNLIDTKNVLERDLHNMEQNSNEIDYYVNTASILFKYYDIVEKGAYDEMTANNKVIKEQSILKYFMPKANEKDETKVEKDDVDDRASLLDKYLAYTDVNYLKSIDTECKDTCTCCGSTNRNILLNDGMIFCNDCDTIEYIIVDHDRPSYRDPPKEISYFAYKRISDLCVKVKCMLYKIYLASVRILFI